MMKPVSCLLLVAALLLAGCATQKGKELSCSAVDCRPQSNPNQLVIWWQPELRNTTADFTQVSVNE